MESQADGELNADFDDDDDELRDELRGDDDDDDDVFGEDVAAAPTAVCGCDGDDVGLTLTNE